MAYMNGVRPQTRDTFAARKREKVAYNSATNLVIDFVRRTKCDCDTVCKLARNKDLF